MKLPKSVKRPSLSYQEVLSSLSAGLIIGILIIFVEVSFSALIFSGELADFVAPAIGFNLFGALVMGIVVALSSSFPGSIILPQDTPAAILSVVAAAVVAAMPAARNEEAFATVVAAMMVSTIITGMLFWLMGRFNLGRLVRFIPYPVIGGFLAGAGWLLVVGAIGVMTEAPFGPALFQPDALPRWLPGLVFALALLILLRRFSHFLLMPALLLSGIGLFYLFYFISFGSVASASDQGWLLGPFPDNGLYEPVFNLVLTRADWRLVLGNIVNLSTIFLVSAIALLLNASGLELAVRKDISLNRELKSAGVANILAGLGGSMAGFHALSLSALGYRLGARSRLIGLFCAALVGFALFFGASLLSVFPKMIAGGFLLFLGLDFLMEWIYDAWFKLPKSDYALIWLILIVIAGVGFLEGVAVGIMVAGILFVINYSRTKVVRHAISGADYQSHVMRPRLYEQLLHQRGNSMMALELQGFIFFGTAYRLVEHIRARIENPDAPVLKYLLLDFRLVTGIDTSATLSFSRLMQLLEGRELDLVLTHMSPYVQRQIQKEVLTDAVATSWHIFSDLDHGFAWCEEQMIAVLASVGLAAKPKTFMQYLDESLPNATGETDWLDELNPLNRQRESPHLSRILAFMQRQEVEEDTVLLLEGEEVNALSFIEQGKVVAQTKTEDGQVTELRVLGTGTLFGEISMYTQGKATATIVTKEASVLYTLSRESLSQMETDDPELAIAIHRLIAGNLSRKLSQASHTIRALQS